jgi:hypothetical protein
MLNTEVTVPNLAIGRNPAPVPAILHPHNLYLSTLQMVMRSSIFWNITTCSALIAHVSEENIASIFRDE